MIFKIKRCSVKFRFRFQPVKNRFSHFQILNFWVKWFLNSKNALSSSALDFKPIKIVSLIFKHRVSKSNDFQTQKNALSSSDLDFKSNEKLESPFQNLKFLTIFLLNSTIPTFIFKPNRRKFNTLYSSFFSRYELNKFHFYFFRILKNSNCLKSLFFGNAR